MAADQHPGRPEGPRRLHENRRAQLLPGVRAGVVPREHWFRQPGDHQCPQAVRLQWHGPEQSQPGTAYICNNTITGKVTGERLSRTPDERLYSSGSHDTYYWSQCYVSFGDPDGEDFAFTKCNGDGTFTLTGLPAGDWRVTVFDQWNDLLVDGLSTPVGISWWRAQPSTWATSPRPSGRPTSTPGPSSTTTRMASRRPTKREFRSPTSRCGCATAAWRTCWSRTSPVPPISTRRSRCSAGTRWKPT